MSNAAQSFSQVSRRIRAAVPMIWVWITVLAAVVVTGSVMWLDSTQERLVKHFTSELELLREARVDLVKGYLNILQANVPQSPFNKAQGLALIDQAEVATARALSQQAGFSKSVTSLFCDAPHVHDRITLFANAVSKFKGMLETDYPSATAMTLELHIAFSELERQADEVDAAINDDMAHVAGHYELTHTLILSGSVFLLLIICLGIYRQTRARRKAEQAMLETEEIFRQFMDNSPIHVFFKDRSGKTLRLSRNFEDMLGRPIDELVGKTMEQLFPAEFASRIMADDRRIMEKGEQIQVEETFAGRTYTTIKFPINISGKARCVAGYTIDITERKRAEQARRDSEELLHTFMDNVPSMVIIKDEQLKPLFFNRKFYEVFPGHEWLGKTPHETFSTEVADAMRKADEKALRERLMIYEESWVDKDGEKRTLETRKFVIEREGVPPRLGVVITDITDRKKVEVSLAAEKERLAVTLRSIGDGVITTDTFGNVVIINKIAEDLTGWTQVEALGRPLHEVFHVINETTRKTCENPVKKVLATGKIIELANHTVLVSRDGTERVIADSGAPIKDANGAILGVVLVFRDTTEKQKMLDNMQRTDKLDSLGVLAGGIAHDFNNLLSGVFGYIDLARESCAENPEAAKSLDKSLAVFNRAKDLTQQLLTFAKGAAPARKTGDLEPIIKDSASFALSGSDVAGEYHFDKKLWPCDFDENQIGQVIDNIVINAQQAMPAGGTIVVSANNVVLKEGQMPSLRGGRFIRISIKDAGIGIQPDLIGRIFDPFFTTKHKGSGLGLATCYSIVHKHDGYIEVESQPGKGSTFHVYLPASEGEVAERVLPQSMRHHGSGRILVMDDEVFIREILGQILQRMGYTTIEARDGNEALRLCSEVDETGSPIVGMILDLTIPGGMGGREAIAEIRKRHPGLPVFASSGYSGDPIMAKPTEFGFTDSIRKPYLSSELSDMLNRHMPRPKTN